MQEETKFDQRSSICLLLDNELLPSEGSIQEPNSCSALNTSTFFLF